MWNSNPVTRSSHWRYSLKEGALRNLAKFTGKHLCLSLFFNKVPGLWQICSKFAEEHACRSVISMKLLFNFIEITLRDECSLLNLLHIFRTPFNKNTYGGLLLDVSQRLRHVSAMSESVSLQFLKKIFRSKIRPSPSQGHS